MLHEIAKACAETCNFSSVSLDNPNPQIVRESTGYEIRIKGDLDFGTQKRITPILQKHNLLSKQKGDSLVIYRAHK